MRSVERLFHLLFRGLHFEKRACSKSSFFILLLCLKTVTGGSDRFKPILELITLGGTGQKYMSLRHLGFVGDFT